jgi:hypothetical protein
LRSESLEVEEVGENAVTPDKLSRADVVILANCGALQPGQFQALRDFVNGGGGLLIFPGDKVNPDRYNREFFTAPGAPGVRLTAAELAAAEGDPERADTFERLAVIDFDHPALTVFDDPEGRLLRSLRVFRRFGLRLPAHAGSTRSLARFASGQPALVESPFGDGTVILAAFPAHVSWTNLPLKPEFVPLVLRLTGHVLRRPDVEGPGVVAPGALAEVSVAGSLAAAKITVTDPAGRPQPPPTFKRTGSRVTAGFDQTQERGYYTVDVAGDGVGTGRGGTVVFAVNLDPQESDLTPLPADALPALFPGIQVDVIDASARAQQLYGALDSRHEVWGWLIYALLILMAGEFLLATLRGGKAPVAKRR